MKNSRNAFTMLELIFVIVVLGILAAIAVPRFAATRTDAQIAKGRSDISSIRSAIVSDRQAHLIKGDSKYITGLSSSSTKLFDGNGTTGRTLLMYPIASGTTDGHWRTTDNASPYIHYRYKVGDADVSFDYNKSTGIFSCSTTSGTQIQKDMCKKLIN